MKIQISTPVKKDYKNVFEHFDKKLFLALAPPLLPFRLLRFDGCEKGQEVHIELAAKQRWISLITEKKISEQEIYFIDEGTQLPPPLKTWQHKHRLLNTKKGTLIVDEIQYQCAFKLLDYIVFPVFYMMFYWRKHIYQRFFGRI
ncbi:MAG: hypothetical protein ACPG5B_15410 [Chitinophagales bacterium]